MEAVLALSLACNVLQVAETGCKVAGIFKQAYENGTTDTNETLASVSQNLNLAISKLDKSVVLPATQNDSELQVLAHKCARVATELQQKVAWISQTASRRRDRLKKGVQAVWTKSDIEKLATKLKSYREALDTQILVDLRANIDMVNFKQQEHFKDLDQTLQDFIHQQALTQEKEHQITRDVIRGETHDLATKLQDIRISNNEKEEYDRLVASLTFPAMNSRKNQISNAHPDTFEWIFGKPTDANSDTYDSSVKAQNQDDHQYKHQKSSTETPWNNFTEWLKTGEEIYWICGKAGSGKSTLVNFISHHHITKKLLEQWSLSTAREICILEAYIWNAGSEIQRSLRGVLAGLNVQLLRRFPHLKQELLHNQPNILTKFELHDWSRQDLQSCLNFLLNHAPARFCIFIDGLDEAEATRYETMQDVLDCVQELSRLSSVKCCVSSRPLKRFEDAFHALPQLRLETLNAEDMTRVFRDRLKPAIKKSGLISSKNDFDQLERDFNHKASGVFLWAHLATESLKEGLEHLDSLEELHERLRSLPPELEDMFELMLKKSSIDSKLYQEQTARMFRLRIVGDLVKNDDTPTALSLLDYTLCLPQNEFLLDCARSGTVSPKSIDSCRVTRTHLQTRCAGLLEVVSIPNEGTWSWIPDHDIWKGVRNTDIQFIHRSVKDFLLTTRSGQEVLSHRQLSDYEIFRSILRAKLYQMLLFHGIQADTPMGVLLDYVASVRVCKTEVMQLEVLQEIEAACEAKPLWLSGERVWRSQFPLLKHYKCGLDFLGFTVVYGLTALANHYLNDDSKQFNPAYSKYCLMHWDHGLHTDSDLFDAKKWRDAGLRLTASLLRHSYPQNCKKSGLVNDSDIWYHVDGLPGDNTPKLAVWNSVPTHLVMELLDWELRDLFNGFDLERSHFLYRYLVSYTNLRKTILFQMSIGRNLNPGRRRLGWGFFPNSSAKHLLYMECNVCFILNHLLEHYVIKRDSVFYIEMRALMETSGVKPKVTTFLTGMRDEDNVETYAKVNEADSTFISGFIAERASYWLFSWAHNSDHPRIDLETIKAKVVEAHERGESVDYLEYLKETGWFKDPNDPAVILTPPSMYLGDDDDDNNDNDEAEQSEVGFHGGSSGKGARPASKSSNGSASEAEDDEEEYFDAEETIR